MSKTTNTKETSQQKTSIEAEKARKANLPPAPSGRMTCDVCDKTCDPAGAPACAAPAPAEPVLTEPVPAPEPTPTPKKTDSELVGYITRFWSGGALRINISVDAFARARRYVCHDGHEYVGLVVNLDKVRAVIDGEREVTGVCQIVDGA